MAVVAEHAMIELESSLTLEERLDKQRWYIGEMTQETAESLLSSSGQPHSFVVYSLPGSPAEIQQHTLSARFPVEGVEEGVIEHLAIHCQDGGKYTITGQSDEYDDVIEAVNCYVLTSDPPLIPALQGKSFETQISIRDAPPEYDKANKVLKPDIAPLPDITKVKIADKTEVEAQSGRISPTGTQQDYSNNSNLFSGRSRSPSSYLSMSIWVRYSEHGRCHPKNVCYGCCYRPVRWNGNRVCNKYAWYNPCGSGPLRVLGILLFWLFFSCFCIFLCFDCRARRATDDGNINRSDNDSPVSDFYDSYHSDNDSPVSDFNDSDLS